MRADRLRLRSIEIKHQRTLPDAEEESIKDDAFDYLTGVAHTKSGRFVANGVTADVYVSHRPQREYDAEELQKIKHLEEQLSQAKRAGVIIHQTPYLVVRILNSCSA